MMARQQVRQSIALSFLLDGIADVSSSQERDVYGVSIDSRKVKDGDVFIAYMGDRVNGCEYIEDAINAGAAAVLWDSAQTVVPLQIAKYMDAKSSVTVIAIDNVRRFAGEIAAKFHGYPSREMNVIGITGTNGKTSCSHFLSQVLNNESPTGLVGTLGYGIYGALEETGMTTPDPVTLQTCLKTLSDAGVRNVVMEVSSHALEQDRITGTDINVAVFTNLSRDHLDYHDNMDAYGRAKKKLFDMASVETVVINVDDEFGRQLVQSVAPGKQCISYGCSIADPMPVVYASVIEYAVDGVSIDIETPWGTGCVHSGLLGSFNVSNLLAVVSSLVACGMDFNDALAQAEGIMPVPGRMQTLGGDGSALFVVDYAHTPDALDQALSTLKKHCSGRLWCVFGCGGDRDKGKRAQMGEIATRLADVVVITDDNPRFESPGMITDDILQGVSDESKVELIHDRSRAIQKAVSEATSEDVVLVAGKGHENYQLIGKNKIPFSDKGEIESQLAMLKQQQGSSS